MTSPVLRCLLSLGAGLAAFTWGAASTLPPYDARDPLAPPVTTHDVGARERFWPYRVSLVAPLDDGALAAGETGVLLRVEGDGLARIDFGRFGLRTVAVGATDLVPRANRVRLGEEEKLAPNFLLAIGPRLVDPAAPSLAPLDLSAADPERRWLCIVAAPDAPELPRIAAACRAMLPAAEGWTILFPTGGAADAAVRERLQALEWPVPFVRTFLAESYARGLLPEGCEAPAVFLVTAEGRLLFASRWQDDTPAFLVRALGE